MTSNSQAISVDKIFVAGGLPTITYVPRTALHLEKKVQTYLSSLHKILSIAGPTKSGKTVLLRKVLPKNKAIWISGGEISTVDVFWNQIILKADGFTDISVTEQTEAAQSSGRSAEAGLSAMGFAAKGAANTSDGTKTSSSTSYTRKMPPSLAALQILAKTPYPIVIDDFHYIKKSVQTTIVRALKDPVFDGLPVITLSVPHRMYDSVRVEKEMTGRVEILQVPEWEASELGQIAIPGFKALNVIADQSTVARLTEEAFRSPHLMQEFCGSLCKSKGITTRSETELKLEPPDDWNAFFSERAAHASKTAFDRLVVGPRQRTDRLQRKLKNGETCDIYKAVLLALAYGGPRTTSSYSDIRGWLKEVLEDVPQANEVTAVLQHMSDIAREIEGEPVIDYDKELRQVYLADPFFAYYLRWSNETAVARQVG